MIPELKAHIEQVNIARDELRAMIDVLRIKYGDAIHIVGWQDDPLNFIVCVDLDKLTEDETIHIDPHSN